MLEIRRAEIIMFCQGILGNWASGIFPEWEAHFSRWGLCFDFKHCWLCTVATFFRYLFFIAPWIVGPREISAVDKDSSESSAVRVEGICSATSINRELAHSSQLPLHQEYCFCIPCGDWGYGVMKRIGGWLGHPLSEFLGAAVSPGCW